MHRFFVLGVLLILGRSQSTHGSGLYPEYGMNLMEFATISANASCGQGGREEFCNPMNSTDCDICEEVPYDPLKMYDIGPILREERIWQSPTLNRGDHYEFVSITIDLKKIYQIDRIVLKPGNYPKPETWILEKSLNGNNFEPLQYFVSNDDECQERYSKQSNYNSTSKNYKLENDYEVICSSEFANSSMSPNDIVGISFPDIRPGYRSNTEAYRQFTEMRYIRFSFQKIFRRIGYLIRPKQLFYSVKSIEIMGRCICSGHASRCGKMGNEYRQCQCQRNTDGDMCEKCRPMFNQVAWQPGTSEGYQCEECNCHGHASSCMYDPAIDLQKLSLDTAGKRRGGGVCIGCSNNTIGINCERCKTGFYRPLGANATDSSPCKPCNHCDRMGSTGFCSSQQQSGKVGACECKRGYTGYNCDQCAPGYRGYPKCDPCPCNQQGMLPSSSCEDPCLCKEHVEGNLCDWCKPGYFGLSSLNSKGCLHCECSNITHKCHAANLEYELMGLLDSTWRLANFKGSISERVPYVSFNELMYNFNDNHTDYTTEYWLAPQKYSGNRLSSYGTDLIFATNYDWWTIPIPRIAGPNVVLISTHGLRIGYFVNQVIIRKEQYHRVPLQEPGWYHVKDGDWNLSHSSNEYMGKPVTRSEMLQVLANLKHLMIRCLFAKGMMFTALVDMEFRVGIPSFVGVDSLVEQCHCPEGYSGLSCENCASGYEKIVNGPSNRSHQCIRETRTELPLEK